MTPDVDLFLRYANCGMIGWWFACSLYDCERGRWGEVKRDVFFLALSVLYVVMSFAGLTTSR